MRIITGDIVGGLRKGTIDGSHIEKVSRINHLASGVVVNWSSNIGWIQIQRRKKNVDSVGATVISRDRSLIKSKLAKDSAIE